MYILHVSSLACRLWPPMPQSSGGECKDIILTNTFVYYSLDIACYMQATLSLCKVVKPYTPLFYTHSEYIHWYCVIVESKLRL